MSPHRRFACVKFYTYIFYNVLQKFCKMEICQNNQILEKLVHLSTLCLGQYQIKFLC